MTHRPESSDTLSIEHPSQLEEICCCCRREGRFAFDTEFVMEDRFETDVCLVQVATTELVAIIDPLLDLDLTPIWAMVGDANIETVVHAGQEDLALCVQHTGQPPRRIYDVQIAAGLAGCDYPMSLQKLVQQLLRVRIHKAKTLTDWRRRPLTSAEVRYAAEDVRYLLPARRQIETQLRHRGRVEWAKEEFARLEDVGLYRRAEEEKLLRLKGTGALKPRQLAVVRELIQWREELARRLDRPVRVTLKDHLLVEIARHELAAFREVRSLRGLNLSDRDVRSLCQAVDAALQLPQDAWPVPPPRETETSGEAAAIALATAVLRSHCLDEELAYGLAATKRSIRELLRHCMGREPRNAKDVELLRGWRGTSFGSILKAVLQGHRKVSVERRGNQPHIRIDHLRRDHADRPEPGPPD